MGFQPPQNIPVPLVTIPSINLKLGLWALDTGVGICETGLFVKEAGAADYTAIAFILHNSDAEMKAEIDTKYGGDERKYLQMKVMDYFNAKLDEYLRATFPGWEPKATDIIPTDAQIDAMASEVLQMNYKLARYGSFQIDEAKKTVNVFA